MSCRHPGAEVTLPAAPGSCVGAWGQEWGGWGGNSTFLLMCTGTEQVQPPQRPPFASRLVAHFSGELARVSRWKWSGAMERGSYLEAAEWDHAVHHLGHAETVPEIVEGVVPVIVVDAKLQREREWSCQTWQSCFLSTAYPKRSPMGPRIVLC